MVNETNGRSKGEANNGMTRKEREELAKVVRLRARVAKQAAAQRESELVAQVEDQLAACYREYHELWASITKAAQQTVKEADARIAAVCREHGIPEKLRPQLGLSWYDRGESASKARRDELRKVARSRIEASRKAAVMAIGAKEAELLTVVIAGGLASEEARSFLESIPTVEQLMPPVAIRELEQDAQQKQLPASDHDEEEEEEEDQDL